MVYIRVVNDLKIMPVPVQFVDQNPWWKDVNTLTTDKHLSDFAGSVIKWEPRIKFFFKSSVDAIYTIRGPRQVGKTTLIKILIRDSFKNLYRSADSIFYYSCDLVGDPRQLKEVVSSYLESVRQSSPKKPVVDLS